MTKAGLEEAIEQAEAALAEEPPPELAPVGSAVGRVRRWTVPQVGPGETRARRQQRSERVLMDEPVIKRLVLALVGAVALTAERADELADALRRGAG